MTNPTGTHFVRLVSQDEKPLNLLVKVKGNTVTLFSSTKVHPTGEHKLIKGVTECKSNGEALDTMDDLVRAFRTTAVKVTTSAYLD